MWPAGTNVLREPKVFVQLPYRLIYASFVDCIGALRENYFAMAVVQHGVEFMYLKSMRGKKAPDFLISLAGKDIVIEVGGKGKGRSQFKGVDYDQKIVLYHGGDRKPEPWRSVPLHWLGFPA